MDSKKKTPGAKTHPRRPGTIGARITDRRKSLNWTQKELAKKAGVGIATIHDLEHSIKPEGLIEVTLKVIEALQMDLNEAIYGK